MEALKRNFFMIQAQWRQIDEAEQNRIRNYFNEVQAIKPSQHKIKDFGDKLFTLEDTKEVIEMFRQLEEQQDY